MTNTTEYRTGYHHLSSAQLMDQIRRAERTIRNLTEELNKRADEFARSANTVAPGEPKTVEVDEGLQEALDATKRAIAKRAGGSRIAKITEGRTVTDLSGTSYRLSTSQDRYTTPKEFIKNEDIIEGTYSTRNDGTGRYIRVVKSRESGRMYGKVWDADTERFVYEAGLLRGLRPDMLLTEEQASAFGLQWGVCAICAKTLTNDDSIARGIGPVCAGKMGW